MNSRQKRRLYTRGVALGLIWLAAVGMWTSSLVFGVRLEFSTGGNTGRVIAVGFGQLRTIQHTPSVNQASSFYAGLDSVDWNNLFMRLVMSFGPPRWKVMAVGTNIPNTTVMPLGWPVVA